MDSRRVELGPGAEVELLKSLGLLKAGTLKAELQTLGVPPLDLVLEDKL